ncbi:30S ribosome-binding factor RbfA [soil metagenome]
MRRVNESVREIVGTASASELQDPRIGFVTVTAVDTSPDLRSARIYVSVLGDEQTKEETMAGLQSGHSLLQAVINRDLHMKRTPKLRFVYDEGPERMERISRMLEE